MRKIKYLVFILIVFFVDQISKIIVMNNIKLNNSLVLIKNFFSLTYTHNYGAAFSLFSGKTIFILLVSFVILIYLVYELFKKKSKYSLLTIGNILLIGGLLGNLFDRLYYGYVRDFLDFKIFGYDTAIFNLGDTAIVIGAFIYFIGVIMEEKYERVISK